MIIGSQALKYHFPDFPREPKDIDIVAFDEFDKQDLIRIHKGCSQKIEVLINSTLLNWFKIKGGVPSICHADELYTLKISHSFWKLENGSWDKHIYDIQWLKEKGCKFIPELFYKLFNYWEEIHGKRKASKLDMSAEDFFNNAINCELDHDYIHSVLITHPYFKQTSPTYTKVLKDGCEVDVDEGKFNLLTEEEKFNLAFEEIAVMAFEPRFPKNMYWKRKYKRMLDKFITSHCPIWEGIWIIQNYKQLLTNIPFNFEEYLNQKLCK